MSAFEFTCPDCVHGGERWATAEELREHILAAHCWSEAAIEAEITEQEAMRLVVAS